MSAEGRPGSTASQERSGTPKRSLASRVPSYSRFIVVIPVIGLFVSALTLVVLAGASVVSSITQVVSGDLDKKGALVEFIEIADVFLLATVLYVMALGLYELFVDDQLPVPSWLKIRTLDDLKEKLVGVVVVVMAVFFLGLVVGGSDSATVFEVGVGIGAVTLGLGYFLGNKGSH